MNRWRFLLLIISLASPLFASDGERGAGKNFVMYIQEQYGYAPYAFRTKEGSYLSISQGDTIRKISESGELLWQRTAWTQGANVQYVWLEGIAETADGYVLAGSTWDWHDIPTGLHSQAGK